MAVVVLIKDNKQKAKMENGNALKMHDGYDEWKRDMNTYTQ